MSWLQSLAEPQSMKQRCPCQWVICSSWSKVRSVPSRSKDSTRYLLSLRKRGWLVTTQVSSSSCTMLFIIQFDPSLICPQRVTMPLIYSSVSTRWMVWWFCLAELPTLRCLVAMLMELELELGLVWEGRRLGEGRWVSGCLWAEGVRWRLMWKSRQLVVKSQEGLSEMVWWSLFWWNSLCIVILLILLQTPSQYDPSRLAHAVGYISDQKSTMSSKVAAAIVVVLALASAMWLVQDDHPVSLTADGKVKIDLYSQSLCPDCLAFIKTSLRPAAETKDFWKICEFNLYPYGNARRTQNGSSWSFSCQHGIRECQGNLIQACATRKYEFYTQGLPFALCLEENTTDFVAQGKVCATRYGLDWNAINTCATGAEGNKLMYDISVATDKLNPAHTYVPWIVVNDRHTTSSENAVIKNMVQYVCSIYTGPEKIAACK